MSREITTHNGAREIKFRAWEPTHRRIFSCDIVSGGEGFESWSDYEDGRPKSNILMQFTGLLDKNGKEIYEGDVIYFEDYESEPKYRVVDEQYGMYGVEENGVVFVPLVDLEADLGGEVRGNIYENPELLK